MQMIDVASDFYLFGFFYQYSVSKSIDEMNSFLKIDDFLEFIEQYSAKN